MRFLIDAQLPPAIAQWLTEAGHEAEHLTDVGLRDAEDGVVWAHALRTGAAILSKDEDFADRSIRAAGGPVIVWLRVGNASNRALRAWLDPRLPTILEALATGRHQLIEVR
jgi:predicted nuclease of predicted toxin-antitoxin system